MYVRAAGTLYGSERLGFRGTMRDVPRTGWAASATPRRWTLGTADRRRWHMDGQGGPAPWSLQQPESYADRCTTGDRDRTGTAEVCTPLDRTSRAALSDCTEWGRRAARAGPGVGLVEAETPASRAVTGRDQNVPEWECALRTVTTLNPLERCTDHDPQLFFLRSVEIGEIYIIEKTFKLLFSIQYCNTNSRNRCSLKKNI